ncbi:MAG: hypothetical protein ACYDEN_08575 [Acidimicrobiales bacterium]
MIASADFAHAAGVGTPAAALSLCPLPGVCNLLDPLTPATTSGLAGQLLTVVAAVMTGGAGWVAHHAIGLLAATTRVDLGQGWFTHLLGVMTGVTALVALPLALAGTLGALLRQDPRRLARVWAVGVPVSLAGGGVAVAVVGLSIRAVDGICALLEPSGGLTGLVGAATSRLSLAPPIVQCAVAGLILLGAVALWMELLLRSAAVYLSVFFLPLALAALLWPAVAPALRRFVEVLAALVLAKLLVVGALAVGSAALEAGPSGGVDSAVTAAVVLLIAAFAPFAVLRLVPVVETAGIAHLEGLTHRPAQAVRSAATQAAVQREWIGGLIDHAHNRTAAGLDPTEPPPSMPWLPGEWFPGTPDGLPPADGAHRVEQ